MNRENEDLDNRRFLEKESKFRGSVKVDLKFLSFDDQTTFLDPKNVSRLERIFDLEGCLRSNLEHYVPVVISEPVLNDALARSSVTQSALITARGQNTLDFDPEIVLRCLHGRHRLAAARKHLMNGDKWWTVDLYLDSLATEVQCYIGEEYANSKNFCDGDIFREIRRYQIQQDLPGEQRWKARLSECKRGYLKQFQTRDDLRHLNQALGRLLEYPGFWPALQIGNFHRLFNLKCPEELSHYVDHIRITWDKIIGHTPALKSLIDFQTVQYIQSCCPGVSHDDWEYLIRLMAEKKLFPMVTDRDSRAKIIDGLRDIGYIIPSLYTFFEDTKWLEPCAKIMRTLVEPQKKESVCKSFQKIYTGINTETGCFKIIDSCFKPHICKGPPEAAFLSGYRQLWLCAWREFPELSGLLPRKDTGKSKPRERGTNHQSQRRLAKLAMDLGFSSTKLKTLADQDSDDRMIREFISQARPSHLYDVDDTDCILAMHQALNTFRERVILPEPIPQPEVPRDRRCGRPYEGSYEKSKHQFFFPQVYESKPSIVSHLVLNCQIFRAFFGFEARITNFGDPTTNSTVNVQGAPECRPPDDDPVLLERVNGSVNFLPPSTNDPIGPASVPTNLSQNPPDITPMITDYEDPPAENSAAVGDAVHKVGLFESWQQYDAGDLLFISMDTPETHHLKCKDETEVDLRKVVADMSNRNYCFACYDPESQTTKVVVAEQITNLRKSEVNDGIIYTLNRNNAYKMDNERTTQERLATIEKLHKGLSLNRTANKIG